MCVQFSMIVYNSLGRPYTGMIRVPVITESISITDPDGNSVPVQVTTALSLVYVLHTIIYCRLYLLVISLKG